MFNAPIREENDTKTITMGGWHEEESAGGGFRETRGENNGSEEHNQQQRSSEHRPRNHEVPKTPPFIAYVGNFPFEMTQEAVLEAIGAREGGVVGVRAMTDRSKTKVRGLFVEFVDADALREALKADGAACGDRTLRVNVAEERSSPSSGRNSMDKGRRDSSDRRRGGHHYNAPRVEAMGIVQPDAERKKLVLQPRTVEVDADETAVGAQSIFGGAKPVDTTKILEEVERKIDAELHREHKMPTPKKKREQHHAAKAPLKMQDEPVATVEDANVFSLLSIEDDS